MLGTDMARKIAFTFWSTRVDDIGGTSTPARRTGSAPAPETERAVTPIPQIPNPFLRRTVLVLTVAAILVCLGPLAMARAALEWVEREFDVDLAAAWRGDAPGAPRVDFPL